MSLRQATLEGVAPRVLQRNCPSSYQVLRNTPCDLLPEALIRLPLEEISDTGADACPRGLRAVETQTMGHPVHSAIALCHCVLQLPANAQSGSECIRIGR